MITYKTNDPRGWCGDITRGAAMGRPTIAGDPDFSGKLVLRRVRLDAGGYDANNTYFGAREGTHRLYWCADLVDGSIDRMLDATSREEARAQVLAWYPNAKVHP